MTFSTFAWGCFFGALLGLAGESVSYREAAPTIRADSEPLTLSAP